MLPRQIGSLNQSTKGMKPDRRLRVFNPLEADSPTWLQLIGSRGYPAGETGTMD